MFKCNGDNDEHSFLKTYKSYEDEVLENIDEASFDSQQSTGKEDF